MSKNQKAADVVTRYFPANPASGPFPEFHLSGGRSQRYTKTDVGLAISGGGTRSYSAAIGQLRYLVSSGLIDKIRAISCVSGGTWFGTLFNFVDKGISDQQLLGPMVGDMDWEGNASWTKQEHLKMRTRQTDSSKTLRKVSLTTLMPFVAFILARGRIPAILGTQLFQPFARQADHCF